MPPQDSDRLSPALCVGNAQGLEKRIGLALTALCLSTLAIFFALWLPNYLRWPLYVDSEHFVVIAREWARGIALPYRDTFCYNLPGQIYMFWLGALVFGWNRVLAVQGTDAILLLTFVGLTLVWSRRCFGGLLPGAVALLGLCVFYFECDYRMTAQRTWHMGLLAAASIMLSQMSVGWRTEIASGVLFGTALLVRPDIAAWGPPALGLIAARRWGNTRRISAVIRGSMLWSISACVILALGMLPLIYMGIFNDFLKSFKDGLTGKVYDPDVVKHLTTSTILRILPIFDCFRDYHFTFFSLGIPWLWIVAFWRGERRVKANLAVWIACSVLFGFAALRSRYFLGYLIHPVMIGMFLSISPVVAALRADFRRTPGLGLAFSGLLGMMIVPGIPAYCRPELAWETYTSVARGRHVATSPYFYREAHEKGDQGRVWTDYRECIAYLRKNLPQDYALVNAIDQLGEYGGMALAFPAEMRTGGGSHLILHLSLPTSRFETLLRRVAADRKSAVVIHAAQIASHRQGMPMPATKIDAWQCDLVKIMNEHYVAVARFGNLEVWFRKLDESTTETALSPNEAKTKK